MASSETSDMNPVGEDEEVQPRDACGVFGCVLTDLPSSPSAMMTSPSSASSLPYLGVDHAQTNYVPYTIYLGLVALQHRGQESAGIVTSDGGENELKLHKGHGLVSSIFSEDNLAKLHGKLGIGHTRYSTVGGQNVSNVQPFVVHTSEGPVAVAHNGELVNSKTLRNMVYSKGVGLASLSDSELITQILCLQPPDGVTPNNWPDRIKRLMHLSPISYSLVIMHNDAIYAVRDPHGNRPLCIGRILKNSSVSRSSSFHMTTAYEPGSSGRLTMNGHGSGASAANGVEMSHAGDLHTDEETEAWIVSSESCAFRAVGAQFVREVEPGELVEVSNRGLKSTFPLGRNTPSPASLCIFEYVYFSRPDSIMEGQQIWGVRKRCGEQLARESPCKADLVSTVPESATPAALGFAEELGIPFTEVFCKNRYVGRTFIQPTTRARRIGIAKKFGVLSENVKGKSIVIVDDSIVRGTTIGPIVKMLKSAGATEVHIRIGSPPIKHPCRMGIHIPTRSELIANAKDAARLAEEVGAASLRYLTVEGLVSAVHSQAKPYPLTTARNSTLTSDPSSAGVVKLAADLKSLEIESSLNGHSDGSSTHKTAASTNGVTSNGSCGSGDLTKTGHCTACLTGNYPVALDDW